MSTIIPKNAKLVPEKADKVFSGYIFNVYQWKEEMFDGSQGTFEMLKRPDAMQIIAVDQDKIIVLDEEQPFFGKFMGLPGGRHDNENETELQAAQRELLEETGLSFSNWKLINAYQPTSKIEQFIYIFLATGRGMQTTQKLDAGEKIKVLKLGLDELKDLRTQDKIRFLPEILLNANSIEELINMPEYSTT